MKPYVKIYLDYFNYTIADFLQCEIPGCGERAVHICHTDCKGMGGRKTMDFIENLMAMCYAHDIEYGDKKQHKQFLIDTHLRFMELHGRKTPRFTKTTTYPSPTKT